MTKWIDIAVGRQMEAGISQCGEDHSPVTPRCIMVAGFHGIVIMMYPVA